MLKLQKRHAVFRHVSLIYNKIVGLINDYLP